MNIIKQFQKWFGTNVLFQCYLEGDRYNHGVVRKNLPSVVFCFFSKSTVYEAVLPAHPQGWGRGGNCSKYPEDPICTLGARASIRNLRRHSSVSKRGYLKLRRKDFGT
jgi:hypothetical protein